MPPRHTERLPNIAAHAALPALLGVCALLLVAWPSAATAQVGPTARADLGLQTTAAVQPARAKDPITVFLSGTGGFGGGTGSGASTAEMAALSVTLAMPRTPWVLGLEAQRDWTLTRPATTNGGGGNISSTSDAVHLWAQHDWRSESSWTPFFGAGAGVAGLNSSDGSQTAYASFGLDGGMSYQPGPLGLRVGTRAQFGQPGALVFITLGLRVRLGPALVARDPGE